MSGTFFVTGATGCVGRALLERLAFERSRACGLLRSEPPPDAVAASWIPGDICDPRSYAARLNGIDTVIHLAAKVHSVPETPAQAGEFRQVNVEGTRMLAEAAARAGVRRFLYVSTVAVHTPSRGKLSDAYADSKRAAEALMLGFCHRMEVVIVRPATVYGPHDRGNVYKLIRWIDRGLPPVIGSGANRKSMVFVRTLADALVFLATSGKSGEAYVVTDGRDMTLAQIAETVCRQLGRANRWPRIPLSAARSAAALNEWLAMTLGLPKIVGREAIEKLVEETVFDAAPLFWLGFAPRYDFESAMEETVRWYKHSIR